LRQRYVLGHVSTVTPWHSEEHNQAMYHENVTSHNLQFVDFFRIARELPSIPHAAAIGNAPLKCSPTPHFTLEPCRMDDLGVPTARARDDQIMLVGEANRKARTVQRINLRR
jgi:hypothetical protein